MIRTKVASGEWVRVFPGVYRHAAFPRTSYQDLRAACVATRVAVASHASAAWLWGLLPAAPTRPELIVRPRTGASRLRGITIHQANDLDYEQTIVWKGIPTTKPLRTIVDLAGTASPSELTGAVDAALATRLVTIAGITAELERLRRRGRRGVGPLERHLTKRGFIGAPAPSVLESKMQRIIILTRLPLPEVEVTAGDDGQYRLDFSWRSIMLCIEVDGYVWHFLPEQKQRDDARRNRLQREGWTVIVYNWQDVCDEPGRLQREITETFHQLATRFAPRPKA